MKDSDLSFCEEFAYPTVVQQHLETILNTIVDSGISIVAIMVVGSTARGELSYVCERGSIRLFSDYEFLIVTQDAVDSQTKTSLELELEALSHQLCPDSPLLHIDLGWQTVSGLPHVPHTIAAFEQKETGKVIFGKDCRASLPVISIQSLNKKNANEILYKRLWALLLYLPKDFLSLSLDEVRERVVVYILARNALDLTTVLLPQEGVLLPTYAQRVRYLCEQYTQLRLSTVFDPGFPDFLEECLAARLTLVWEGSLVSFHAKTIGYLERALEFLLDSQNCPSRDMYSSLGRCSSVIFHEHVPIRAAVKHAVRVFVGRRSVQKAAHWPFLNHKGMMTCCFLHMHRALALYLQGDEARASAHLTDAWAVLDRLTSQPLAKVDLTQPFEGRWLELRRDCGHFWREFVRKGRAVYQARHQHIMGWTSGQ